MVYVAVTLIGVLTLSALPEFAAAPGTAQTVSRRSHKRWGAAHQKMGKLSEPSWQGGHNSGARGSLKLTSTR
jgi:hypothetical protein